MMGFLLLMIVPICGGFEKILLRKMRKLNQNTVAIYVNVSSMIFGIIVMLIRGDDFTYIYRIFTSEWFVALLFLYSSATNVTI